MRMRRWGLIAVLATILALLMVGPAFAGGPPGDPPGLDRAIAAQEAHTDALLARPGVVGTAVGLGADGQAVVVIYTASVGLGGLPDRLDGVKVEPVVTGMIVARTDPKGRQPRPVPIGVSTGHPDITAGTLGARVTKGADVFALSNNHVYAAANNASIGDNALQPGPVDGGQDPADAIGTLSDFEPILFDGSDNTIDAAIALSSTANLGNATPSDDGYGTPNSTTVAASVGQAVMKYGRTTKLTHGTVSEINVTVNVCYKARGLFSCNRNFIAKFVDQIAITDGNFSAGGDSGSLIVDTNANPVGLLFAGSSTRTIANRIDPVLARFGVTIDDSAAAPPTPVATGTIAGQVIPGATVSVDTGQSAQSASDGSYMIADVPTGERSVTASATGFESQTKPTTVEENEETTVDFSLVQATETTMIIQDTSFSTATNKKGKVTDLVLNVTVTEADGTTPVAGAEVSVTLTAPDGTVFSGSSLTNSQGKVGFSPAGRIKSGTWTGEVTSVTKDNHVLDAANSDKTAEITI